MSEDIEDRIRKTLSIAFNVPIEQINEKSSLHEIPNWDSFNHVKMVVALEEEFNIECDDSETQSMINFKIITATVYAHL